MVNIEFNGASTFTINNVTLVRNFHSYVSGSKLRIVNAYDTRNQLLPYTSYADISVNGQVYGSAVQLAEVLAPILFSKQGGSGGGIISGSGISTRTEIVPVDWNNDPVEQIVNYINGKEFIVGNERILLKALRLTGETLAENEVHFWEFKPGKGNYGTNGQKVTAGDLEYISYLADSESKVFEIGEIGSLPIEIFVNSSGPYDLNSSVLNVFKGTRNGVEVQYIYIGKGKKIGAGESQTIDKDFIDVSTLQVFPPTLDFSSKLDKSTYEGNAQDLADAIAANSATDSDLESRIETNEEDIAVHEQRIFDLENNQGEGTVQSVSIDDGEPIQPDENGNVNLLFWDEGEWDDVVDPEPEPGDVIILDPSTGFEGWTIDRNSEATYVDANGVIQTAAPNQARIDHSTGEAKILVEEESTNLCAQSKNWENWVSYGVDINGSIITEDTSDGTHQIDSSGAFTGVNIEAGKSYVASAIIDKKESSMNNRFFVVTISNVALHIIVDINTNEYVLKSLPGYFSALQGGIKELPNGLLLVWISGLADQSITSAYQRNRFTNSFSNANTSYVGDGVSSVSLLYYQVEERAEPSSYIETIGSIATRLPDVITRPVPEGTTEISEVMDEAENRITDIPATYQLPVGSIKKIEFR